MQHGTSIGAIAVAAVLWTAAASAQIMDYGKYPNWKGQWVAVPNGGPPRYDPSKPPGRGQQAPLKPEYAAMHEASLRDQAEGGQGLDIGHKCIPSGVPRQMSGILPFEFAFTPDTTYILFQLTTQETRRIYTDGRPWPADPPLTFAGYSLGKWLDTDGDGRFDTLEVETRALRSPRLFDQTGIPMADDGMTIVKERFFLDKDKPDILHAEMTTIDNALTRPWTVMKDYRRLPTVIWMEDNCTEGNLHVGIGDQNYFISGDGHLMPTRKGQRPPDLRYFNQTPK
jgi:hypothetical protein